MNEFLPFNFSKTFAINYNQVIDKVKVALKQEGFEVNTEYEMLDELNVGDIPNKMYRIVCDCTANFIEELQVNEKINFIPYCNIFIQKIDESHVEISAANPLVSMTPIQRKRLGATATKVKELIENIIHNL